MLDIVKAPSEVLSQVTKKVIKIDNSILSLIREMKETLENTRDPEGVGLAAPQVGKSLQIFIMKPTPKSPITVHINPEIKNASGELANMIRPKKSKSPAKLEGCLSLPSIWGTVLRHPYLSLTYMDEDSKTHTKKFKGFSATIIQHEVDHLNGNLFPKRVLEQKGKLYKSHKNEKGEDEFDEIEI
ncbi:MAG: peptide deformylase [Candidatus Levybacteria bacterium RIFCSPHIGHO2_12_FULL_38_12]|nr:MAG: peptide deformylase [Candidatus Levybacteria bacterium RIFCSPHIGHO2_12_FULL_38_12]OGH34389.1 MAG: peptide deformylase [Candidatus Levybacteria bacterium RIFCSPLOWO2_01_FULL_37_20]OGH44426.1 MAG: peptide deformylase [Candidatus Levybacteria bacterium RIFCSPLOWO2_02_FULL_37_18]